MVTSMFSRHLPLILQVCLVANQRLNALSRRVQIDLLYPVLDGIKRVDVAQVEAQENKVCALVVRRRDRLEPLLTCRVPEPYLYRVSALVFVANDLEVNADGLLAWDIELLLLTTDCGEVSRFADVRIAYHKACQLNRCFLLRKMLSDFTHIFGRFKYFYKTFLGQ